MSRGGGELHATDATIVDTVADMEELVGVVTTFAGGIFFEFDRDGTYLRVLTGDPALLVRPAGELLGRPISEVLGSTGELFHDAIRTVFDTEQPTAFDYTLDVQAGRKTFSCELRPHTRPGSATAAPGPKTVILLVRDITAAKALEAKLMQAERLAALGLLAASVGHEIRQPLAYVSASLDTLERELAGAPLSERATTSLANIRGGARRISEITASLDLLARRRSTATSTIDVQRPLIAALDLCASELSGLRVERDLADVPPVRGDEGELCQVFANVLLNAAQSIERVGERSALVTVTLALAGDRVRVSFTDEGSGIATEHIERLFDPFFTTKGAQGGTGLGLFVTRGIVKAHGGTVEVTSTLGAGTTVEVFLPVANPFGLPDEPITGVRPIVAPALVEPPEVSAGSRGAVRPSSSPPSARRLSLLLVDDEPRFLESLRLALEDQHEVETCTKAAEALEILEKDPRRYDIVVCDLAMPNIDGAMFYERMEALGVADRFVLMTGGAFTQRSADFVARNVCPQVAKPFLLDRLLGLLQEITRGRSAS